jgi:GMP synthase (glutamine-hydrolysing)
VKPFLLLATRAEDEAADDEYAGFLEAGALASTDLHRIRMEAGPLPDIDLGDYSGVMVGGSPFNASDPPGSKSPVQLRVERELGLLLQDIVAGDVPFLGTCYGVGLLASQFGGVVDRSTPETSGPTLISVTDDGRADPLFGRLLPEFDAYVGHKESCVALPAGAVLLATGAACPVQAFRIGANVYATQFHPELTEASILTRIRIYSDNGYYDPDSIDDIISAIAATEVTEPAGLLRDFVRRFAVQD